MLYFVVLELTIVTCLIQKAYQNELKNNAIENSHTTTGQTLDLISERHNLLEKLRTVENEPIYDYKDMWWKTINDIPNTTPTLPKLYSTQTEAVISEPTEATLFKVYNGTDDHVDVLRTNSKTNKSKNDVFSRVKAMISINANVDAKKPLKAITPKINIPKSTENNKKKQVSKPLNKNVVKPDISKKNNSLVLINSKVTLPLINDTKVIKDNYEDDVNQMLKVANESVAILNSIPGVNASQFMDYYNFTAKHFGDAGLRQYYYPEVHIDHPGHPDYYNPNRSTTWHLVQTRSIGPLMLPYDRVYSPTSLPFLPSKTTTPVETLFDSDEGSFPPRERNTRPPPEITFPPASTVDFMTDLQTFKKTRKEGFFSTFLIKFLKLIIDKPEKDVSLLSKIAFKEYENLKNDKFIYDFGPGFVTILEDFSTSLAASTVDYTKAYASILYDSIPERKTAIAIGVAAIIDYINTLFNEEEGKELFKALDLLHKYPNTTENVVEVVRKISKAVFAPYIRHSGTMKANMLIEAINNEIKRAKASANLQEIKLKENKRRLGFLSNKTRFAIVDRDNKEEAKKDKKNTKRKVDSKYKTVSFYEIKMDKKNKGQTNCSSTRFTTYDPSNNNGRFKIMTRPKETPSSYIQIMSKSTTNTERGQIRERYHKKTDRINKYKKMKRISYSNDLQVNHDKIIRYEPQTYTTVRKSITRRTLKYKPVKKKYDGEKKLKATINKKRGPKAIFLSKNKDVLENEAVKLLKSNFFQQPIKKIIIVNKIPKEKTAAPVTQTNVRFDVTQFNGPKYTYDDFAFKVHQDRKINKKHKTKQKNERKPKDNQRKKNKRKERNMTMLKKLRDSSSASDEEETLKFNLNDALKHDARYYKVARRANVELKEKRPFDKSSSSNEEAALKANLYNAIGFNHVRNTPGTLSVSVFKPRAVETTKVKRTTTRLRPINQPSSYSDEEEVLMKRLYKFN